MYQFKMKLTEFMVELSKRVPPEELPSLVLVDPKEPEYLWANTYQLANSIKLMDEFEWKVEKEVRRRVEAELERLGK